MNRRNDDIDEAHRYLVEKIIKIDECLSLLQRSKPGVFKIQPNKRGLWFITAQEDEIISYANELKKRYIQTHAEINYLEGIPWSICFLDISNDIFQALISRDPHIYHNVKKYNPKTSIVLLK